MKNPWHSQRWNGNFSHLDGINWTPYLMNILNYNRAKAINDDDGIKNRKERNIYYHIILP